MSRLGNKQDSVALQCGITILAIIAVTTGCHTFKNTKMTVVSDLGERFDTVVSGCAERKSFEATITEIYVEKEEINKVATDAIRHLRHLLILSFSECRIEVVQVAVFRNVPLLKVVRIVRNELKEVLKGVFSVLESVEVVDLSYNEINRIESGAFGNSTTLKEVYVGFNQLEIWSAEWFDKAPNLEVIDFKHNKIRLIPRRAFYDLQQVKKISFDYNDLELIHPEAFIGLTHLEYLGLRYNKLKIINPRSFTTDILIDRMMVDANYLNYLSLRLMAILEVKEINVSGNPWKCPCLDQIHSWLYETNGTVIASNFCEGRNIPVCSCPSTFSYSCRETLDFEVTRIFFQSLTLMDPPLHEYCARL